MRDPNYDPQKEHSGRNWGCSVLGWLSFAALLAFSALFAFKFFSYYRKFQSDGYISLPQASGSMTSRDGVILGKVQDVVPDTELIAPESAAYGATGDDAELIIVEFGDFGCPYCQRASLPLRTLIEQNKDKVRLIYRHYPSEDVNPNSTLAAQAAECAGEQGRFWPMHDKLYLNAPALGYADLVRYAEEINVDAQQFEECLGGERYLSRVTRDVSVGKAIGVFGTPTFFFNGQRVAGALPEDSLRRVVEVFLSMERQE